MARANADPGANIIITLNYTSCGISFTTITKLNFGEPTTTLGWLHDALRFDPLAVVWGPSLKSVDGRGGNEYWILIEGLVLWIHLRLPKCLLQSSWYHFLSWVIFWNLPLRCCDLFNPFHLPGFHTWSTTCVWCHLKHRPKKAWRRLPRDRFLRWAQKFASQRDRFDLPFQGHLLSGVPQRCQSLSLQLMIVYCHAVFVYLLRCRDCPIGNDLITKPCC